MNSMYFSKEDVENGLMTRFIEKLCDLSYESESLYNDIHIRPDDIGAFIVEWVQASLVHAYGGNFEFVDDGQVVCNEFISDDGTYMYEPVD